MIELYINNQKASLDAASQIGLTLNLVNYLDISGRQITYTNQVTLIGNYINDAIFYDLCNLNKTDITVEELNPTFILTDSGAVILEGYILPIELTPSVSYKVQFINKQVEFISGLTDISLRDIWIDYWRNLTGNTSLTGNVGAIGWIPQDGMFAFEALSMANVATFAYTYDYAFRGVAIDNGYISSRGQFTGLDLRLCISAAKYFELLCDYVGYTDNWQDGGNWAIAFKEYAHIYEPSQLSYSEAWRTKLGIAVQGTATNSYSYQPIVSGSYNQNIVVRTDALVSQFTGVTGTRTISETVGASTVLVPNVGFANKWIPKVWLRCNYTVGALVITDEITDLIVQVIQRDTVTNAEVNVSEMPLSVDLRNADLYLELPEFETSSNQYDCYYLRVYVAGNTTVPIGSGSSAKQITWDIRALVNDINTLPYAKAGTFGFLLDNVSTDLGYNYPIEAGQIAPETKALDFVKYLCNVCAIFPTYQGTTATLSPLEFGSTAKIIDWTGLTDFSEGIRHDLRADNYGQNTNFKYKEEELLLNDTGRLTVLGKSLAKNVTLYEAPFAVANSIAASILYGGSFIPRWYAQSNSQIINPPNQYFVWNVTQRANSTVRYVTGDIVWDEGKYYKAKSDVLPNVKPSANADGAGSDEYTLVSPSEAFTGGVTSPCILFADFTDDGTGQLNFIITDTADTYGDANTYTNVLGLTWANLTDVPVNLDSFTGYPQMAYEPTFSQAIADEWNSLPQAMRLSRKVYISVYLQPINVAQLLANPNSLIYIKELSMTFYLMQLNQYYVGSSQLTQVILLPTQ